jgi:hypothetical protein
MADFYQTFKEIIPLLLKLFKEIERQGTLPNSFCAASITLIPKPNKDTTQKELWASIFNEHKCNDSQQHTKKIIHHDQVGFIPGMQGWFNMCKTINITAYKQKDRQKPHDHLNRYRKSL